MTLKIGFQAHMFQYHNMMMQLLTPSTFYRLYCTHISYIITSGGYSPFATVGVDGGWWVLVVVLLTITLNVLRLSI